MLAYVSFLALLLGRLGEVRDFLGFDPTGIAVFLFGGSILAILHSHGLMRPPPKRRDPREQRRADEAQEQFRRYASFDEMRSLWRAARHLLGTLPDPDAAQRMHEWAREADEMIADARSTVSAMGLPHEVMAVFRHPNAASAATDMLDSFPLTDPRRKVQSLVHLTEGLKEALQCLSELGWERARAIRQSADRKSSSPRT